MTLEEERALVRHLRKTLSRGPIPFAKLTDEAQELYDAASVETFVLSMGVGVTEIPDPHFSESRGTVASYALVTAAMMRAFAAGRACEHASKITSEPRPLILFPGARIFSCRECIAGYESLLPDLKKKSLIDEAEVCDLCLEGGVKWFHPITAAHGPVTVIAEICEDCLAEFRGGVTEEAPCP